MLSFVQCNDMLEPGAASTLLLTAALIKCGTTGTLCVCFAEDAAGVPRNISSTSEAVMTESVTSFYF